MRKSQSAMEFMLLISALLLMAIPTFYLLSNYAFKSSSSISEQQMHESGQRIVDEAREIYYLGKFSKEIISISFPRNIDAMSLMIINDSTIEEYYLIINYTNDGKSTELLVPSDVPMITGNACPVVTGCYAGKDCTTCKFMPDDYSNGVKSFKLETIPSWEGRTVVNISKIDW